MVQPGDIIDDRYEVLALVGQGGLAEVFKVRHRSLGSIHAVKLLTWRRPQLAERLVLEGRIQAQLKHPNIVAVTDLVRHEGQVGLLMEYVEGETLEECIARRPMALDMALRLFSGVLSAVATAHNSGVLHRDLKPANIMLAQQGSAIVPKVTDFGLAKVMIDSAKDMTAVGVTMGTPGYLPPEQLMDAASADQRADIFALGVIFYELLTGTRAFANKDGDIPVDATATKRPRPLATALPHTPTHISEAVAKAMQQDPDKRWSDCQQFAQALFKEHPTYLEVVQNHLGGGPLSLDIPSIKSTASNPPGTPPSGSTYTSEPAQSRPRVVPHATHVPMMSPPLEPSTKRPWIRVALALALLLPLLFTLAFAAFVFRSTLFAEAPLAITPPIAVDVAPEPTAPTPELAVPTTEPAAPLPDPEPATRPHPTPTAAPRTREPTPEPAASPEPIAPTPAETVPTIRVIPIPRPIEQPQAVVTLPEPTPTPEPATPPALTGSWTGTAGRQRMTLDLQSTDSGQLHGRLSLSLGPTVRHESLSGTVRADGALSFTAGDLSFTGNSDGNALSGTYMSQRGRAQAWSATR